MNRLAQKGEVLGSVLTGGNILLLECFVVA